MTRRAHGNPRRPPVGARTATKLIGEFCGFAGPGLAARLRPIQRGSQLPSFSFVEAYECG